MVCGVRNGDESVTDQLVDGASLWQHKPWWCQPWSIVLTGVGVVSASWLLWRLWWISAPVLAAVLMWWWLFLVAVPASYRAQASGDRLHEPTTGP
jgi:hypothetical protein